VDYLSAKSVAHWLGLRDQATKDCFQWSPPLSIEDVHFLWESTDAIWQNNTGLSQLISALQNFQTKQKIDIVIAFVLESISNIGAERSVDRHQLVLTVFHTLQLQNLPSAYFAQDPIYNQVDTAVPASKGIKALDNPKGFLKVNESTLVISIASGVPVKPITNVYPILFCQQ
jgi:hypothetical protein